MTRPLHPLALLVLAAALPACDSSESATDALLDADLSVTFETTPADGTTLRYARFAFSALDANSYECALGDADFEPCASPLFLEHVNEGENVLQVRGVTEGGYIGEAEPFSWTVGDVLAEGHDDLIATAMMPSAVEERSWRGIFRINCDFSHSAYDDPIVFPGRPDAAHLHRFYGNTDVDAYTTMESLYT